MKYGSYFSITSSSIHVMVNGYMFSLYKSLNTNRYKMSCWCNVWRRTRTKIVILQKGARDIRRKDERD